eukprot:Rmarinus@m.18987
MGATSYKSISSMEDYIGQEVDVYGNGKVIKTITSVGHGSKPDRGSICEIDYTATTEKGVMFDATKGTDQTLKIVVGRGHVLTGWDDAMLTMREGENSKIRISPEYAYGREGHGRVGPGEFVNVDVKLLHVGEREELPPFPSEEELAAARKENEERMRKFAENYPTPLEQAERAKVERDLGNELFKQGRYEEAKKQYDKAFVNMFRSREEWEFHLSEEDKAILNAAKLPCHLNRCMCKLKLNQMEDALWDADQALEIDSDSLKGRYRRALIYLHKAKVELTKEEKGVYWDPEDAFKIAKKSQTDFEKALAASPHDKLVIQGLRELRGVEQQIVEYKKAYLREQKKMFRKVVHKMDEENKAESSTATASSVQGDGAEDDVYADMPPLE